MSVSTGFALVKFKVTGDHECLPASWILEPFSAGGDHVATIPKDLHCLSAHAYKRKKQLGQPLVTYDDYAVSIISRKGEKYQQVIKSVNYEKIILRFKK